MIPSSALLDILDSQHFSKLLVFQINHIFKSNDISEKAILLLKQLFERSIEYLPLNCTSILNLLNNKILESFCTQTVEIQFIYIIDFNIFKLVETYLFFINSLSLHCNTIQDDQIELIIYNCLYLLTDEACNDSVFHLYF